MQITDITALRPPGTERYQLRKVQEYLSGSSNRVCTLYGLRRTGKTTLMEQAVCWLLHVKGVQPQDILYITGENNGLDTMQELFEIIEKTNATYIFVDEVSFFNDFIECAATLYNSFTRQRGKKLVIAGTNLTSIFVSSLSALYDRTEIVRVHHLTYFEHCKFLKHGAAPEWSGFIEYLKTGGLFFPTEINEYIQTSIIEHLDDTLYSRPVTNVYNWIDTNTYPEGSWRGIINNICLYSAGNIDNTILHKVSGFQTDRRHIEASGIKLDSKIIAEAQEYYDLAKRPRWAMKQNEVKGLLRFLDDCGFLCSVENLASNPPSGDRTKTYLTFPFMRYAFTDWLYSAAGAEDMTSKSELLGDMLEGCAISEYKLAYPQAPIHFWRERIDAKVEECDLVVTDATELIPLYKQREAVEIKLGHDAGYSGLYAMQKAHPEYGIKPENCKKLEGEAVMNWIYELGSQAYAANEG